MTSLLELLVAAFINIIFFFRTREIQLLNYNYLENSLPSSFPSSSKVAGTRLAVQEDGETRVPLSWKASELRGGW